MNVHILNQGASILDHFLLEIRDEEVQKDRMRFRKNMERIGEIMAYEISKKLDFAEIRRQSPLAPFNTKRLSKWPYLICLLRASLPFFQGLQNYFDQSAAGFIGAYRKPASDSDFDIKLDYVATDDLTDKIVLLADPMLATGRSLVDSIHLIYSIGRPRHIHIASVISSQPGIDYVRQELEDVTLWSAAVDPELNEKSYIVPGLGDAGDLAFGKKL